MPQLSSRYELLACLLACADLTVTVPSTSEPEKQASPFALSTALSLTDERNAQGTACFGGRLVADPLNLPLVSGEIHNL